MEYTTHNSLLREFDRHCTIFEITDHSDTVTNLYLLPVLPSLLDLDPLTWQALPLGQSQILVGMSKDRSCGQKFPSVLCSCQVHQGWMGSFGFGLPNPLAGDGDDIEAGLLKDFVIHNCSSILVFSLIHFLWWFVDNQILGSVGPVAFFSPVSC